MWSACVLIDSMACKLNGCQSGSVGINPYHKYISGHGLVRKFLKNSKKKYGYI